MTPVTGLGMPPKPPIEAGPSPSSSITSRQTYIAESPPPPSNFHDRLPTSNSELAQQLTRDPYVFEFLDLAASALERDIEQALMDRLRATLLEFGRGFTGA